MNNVVPMRARAPWTETNDGKLLAQWKWLRALHADPKVSSAGKHVALYLLDKFDESKGYAFPGYASIMKANGIGRRAAMGAIDSLEREGWFRVRRSHVGGEGTGGPRTVNHYYPQWGRATEQGSTGATATGAVSALPPSAVSALPAARISGARQSPERTGQCHNSTGQCQNEHWGSAVNDTGAVPKPLPDSTYSTYSIQHPAHDSAYAPEVSGGGRASAPSKPGSASRLTGILITEDWRPGEHAWAKGVEKVGVEAAQETLDNFRAFKAGGVVEDPETNWLEWCEPF